MISLPVSLHHQHHPQYHYDSLLQFHRIYFQFWSLTRKCNNVPDVNSRREDCTTPLWFAAAKGQEAAVRYLIKNGADSSIADKDGALPVMLAAQEGHLDIVRLLLEPDLHKNVPEASTFVFAQKDFIQQKPLATVKMRLVN